jgi:hypothetical protein
VIDYGVIDGKAGKEPDIDGVLRSGRAEETAEGPTYDGVGKVDLTLPSATRRTRET